MMDAPGRRWYQCWLSHKGGGAALKSVKPHFVYHSSGFRAQFVALKFWERNGISVARRKCIVDEVVVLRQGGGQP